MICKLQDKDNEISSYKAKEILEEKLRRKQELEIKSLKVELRKVCLTKFEFEKATHTIINLKIQVEEVTKIKEAISNSLKDQLEKSAT